MRKRKTARRQGAGPRRGGRRWILLVLVLVLAMSAGAAWKQAPRGVPASPAAETPAEAEPAEPETEDNGGAAPSRGEKPEIPPANRTAGEEPAADGGGDAAAGEPSAIDCQVPVPASQAVELSYFDDAVFIGDSRTEGLFINTGLSNATFLTHQGLTVSEVFTKAVVRAGGEETTVMDALAETSFGKVYIMLGINETGWVYDSIFIEKYGEIIDAIRALNPDAVIYVQSILPVTDAVSATHSYIKNERIADYNQLLQAMAREKEVYYLDVAEAVAAEDGSLPEDAAIDGIHLRKEACQTWLTYLREHTAAGPAPEGEKGAV